MSYFDTCVNFKAIGSMSTWRLDNEDHLKKLSGKVTFFKNSSLYSRATFPDMKKDGFMWVVNYCNKFDASNCLNGSSELSASEMHLSKLYIDINLVKVTKVDGNAIFFDVFKGHTVDESVVLNVVPYESDYHCKDNFVAYENESKWSESADFETMLQTIPKCEVLDSPIISEPQTDEERDNSLDHEDSSSQPASPLSKDCLDKLGIPELPKENKFLKQELKSNSFTCKICSKRFSAKGYLQKHVRRHELHHRCEICKQSFENKRLFNRHAEAFHDTKIYCDLCNKSSKTKSQLRKHMEIHMDNRRVTCPKCGKIFASEKTLKLHIRNFHENQPYHCDICNKILYSRTNLVSHMLMHNRSTMKHQCSTCGKFIKNIYNLDRHIKNVHTKERRFQCSICNGWFGTKYGLKKHLLTRHGGEKPYCCELCGARFTACSSLKEHFRRHRGEKPFKCNICGKAFSGKSDWRKHIRTHNRLDP